MNERKLIYFGHRYKQTFNSALAIYDYILKELGKHSSGGEINFKFISKSTDLDEAEKAISDVLSHSECRCKRCSDLSMTYFKPQPKVFIDEHVDFKIEKKDG